MPTADPIMAMVDRLPVGPVQEQVSGPGSVAVPFGLRFATRLARNPVGSDDKSQYTVTLHEPTEIIHDGTKQVIQDEIHLTRED
jgi:hypothetical protein